MCLAGMLVMSTAGAAPASNVPIYSDLTVDENHTVTFVDPDFGESVEIVGTRKTLVTNDPDHTANGGSGEGAMSAQAACTLENFLGTPYKYHVSGSTYQTRAYASQSASVGCTTINWHHYLHEDQGPWWLRDDQPQATGSGETDIWVLKWTCANQQSEDWRHSQSGMIPSIGAKFKNHTCNS